MNEYLLFSIQVIAWSLVFRQIINMFPKTKKAIKDLFCKHKETISLNLENNGKVTMIIEICNNCKVLLKLEDSGKPSIQELV